MNLTKDNALVGMKIAHRTEGENLYVYKINDKSFYAGLMNLKEVEEYESSKKYSTFSKLMEAVGGKQYQYKDFEIDESKEQEKHLSPSAEKLIQELYKVKQGKKGSWRHSNFINKIHVVLLSANNEGKCVVRYGDDTIFYHTDSGTQRLFDYEKDKSGKKILWENLEIF